MSFFTHESLSAARTIGSMKAGQLTGTLIAKASYRIVPGGVAEAIPSSDEDDAPQPMPLSGDVFADDDVEKELLYPSDFAPFKPRADIVAIATAHAPGGVPVKSFQVALQVGKLAKTLIVHGHRPWKQGMIARSGPGDALPFTALPIRYTHALGSAKSRKNPVGCGVDSDDAPQIENLKAPIQTPRDGSDPAGFGPLSWSWTPRSDMVGRYRGNWARERWPWLPTDFDYGYFNAAPPDQQFDGFLRGDETVVLQNLHPEHADLRCRLPGVRVRCFLLERGDGGGGSAGEEKFRDVPMALDTLVINVETMTLHLVWRGVADVRSFKMNEIQHVLVWPEPIAQPPGTPAHYRGILDEQMNPKEEEELEEIPDNPDDDVEGEMALLESDAAKAEADLLGAMAAEKAAAIADGVDPKLLAPTNVPGPDASLQALLADTTGLTPDQVAAFQSFAAQMSSATAEFAGADAEFDAEFPEPPTRDDVLAIIAAKGSLAEFDLSGMDLSKLNLETLDFNGANLSKANLSGSRCAGANFLEANLAEADLSGADLTGANFEDADLAKAKLAGAKARQLNLTGTALTGLDLSGVDFAKCHGNQPNFSGSKLPKCRFEQVDFYAPDFSDCEMPEANFSGAKMHRADFDGAAAPGASFEGASIAQMSASEGAIFERAIFKNAVGPKCSFEGANLAGSDFSRARFPDSLFGEAVLRSANFDRADLARGAFDDADLEAAKLTNANFLRANFERANLTNADLTGSNFYEAGFWDAVVKDATLKSAIVRGTLLES